MSMELSVYRVSAGTYQIARTGSVRVHDDLKNVKLAVNRGLNGKPVASKLQTEALLERIVSGSNPLYAEYERKEAHVELADFSFKLTSRQWQEVPLKWFKGQIDQKDVLSSLFEARSEDGVDLFVVRLSKIGIYREAPLSPGVYLPEETASESYNPETYCPFITVFADTIGARITTIGDLVVGPTQTSIPVTLLENGPRSQLVSR